MEDYERERIESLIGRDAELRRLWEEHRTLESSLAALAGHIHLSPGEELERKRLQKVKLAGMDRIAVILAKYRA